MTISGRTESFIEKVALQGKAQEIFPLPYSGVMVTWTWREKEYLRDRKESEQRKLTCK